MYTTRINKHGQIDVIRAADAAEPHVYVTYWDGGMYSLACIPARDEPSYRPGADQRSVAPVEWIDG